jgi:Holliday junction resolvase
MAQTPEGRVKAACVALIKKHDAYHFFAAANGYGRAGIPDIIVCYKGYFLGIECKAGKNTTTALQEREIAHIHRAGGSAMVVREDTVDLLDNWFEGKKC